MTAKATTWAILATALAGALLHAQSKTPGLDLWRSDREAWIERELEFNQVPPQDREDLKRLCLTIPISDNEMSYQFSSCLYGWWGLRKQGESDFHMWNWFNLIDTVPYGEVNIGCEQKKDYTLLIRVFFVFRKFSGLGVPIAKKRKDRVHLELGFSRTVSDEQFGVRFKEEIIKYPWPSRSWQAKHTPKDSYEHMYIARFYDDEAADIIRKIYRSRYVHFTDRSVGETNTLLVTSRGRKVIETIMSQCQLSLDEASAAKATSATN